MALRTPVIWSGCMPALAESFYRPMGQAWAPGANLNHVQQRDFDQHFGLRDYRITTGHASLYYSFDAQERIVGSLSVGRYLAGDYGATINVARVFDNGMSMGAYVTKTDMSAKDFGEVVLTRESTSASPSTLSCPDPPVAVRPSTGLR